MQYIRQNHIMSTQTTTYGYPHVAVSSTGQLAASVAYGMASAAVSHAFALYDTTSRTW